jgi:hypothetical protein
MSDPLTHRAVFEDCRRLARHDERIAPEFRDLIERERAIARLGAITWRGRLWMEPFLTRARAGWAGAGPTPAITRACPSPRGHARTARYRRGAGRTGRRPGGRYHRARWRRTTASSSSTPRPGPVGGVITPRSNRIGATKISACRALTLYSWM